METQSFHSIQRPSGVSQPGLDITIAKKASADLVMDYIEYALSYILYKRMVYPRDHFGDVHKFGVNLVVLRNVELRNYLSKTLRTAHDWAVTGELQRIVLCTISVTTGETLERWQFHVDSDHVNFDAGANLNELHVENVPVDHNLHAIHNEITQVLKQIGISFLPPLEETCAFKILLYTKTQVEVPARWRRTHPHYIKDGTDEHVQFRNVTAPFHVVKAQVIYRNPD